MTTVTNTMLRKFLATDEIPGTRYATASMRPPCLDANQLNSSRHTNECGQYVFEGVFSRTHTLGLPEYTLEYNPKQPGGVPGCPDVYTPHKTRPYPCSREPV